MRTIDQLTLPLVALAQQKSRTLMTTLGVTFGAFVLAASLSIGQGVQDTIYRETHRTDFLRKVHVQSKWITGDVNAAAEVVDVPGKMSAERRDRLRHAIRQANAYNRNDAPQLILSQKALADIEALPHVEAVVPVIHERCFAILDGHSEPIKLSGGRPGDDYFGSRLVAGRMFDADDQRAAVVNELLLYRFGVVDEKSVPMAIGKKIRLQMQAQAAPQGGFRLVLLKPDGSPLSLEQNSVLAKITAALPAALDKLNLSGEEVSAIRAALAAKPDPAAADPITEEVTIVGVTRQPTAAEQKAPWDPSRQATDVVIPYRLATDIAFRQPGYKQFGVNEAVVITDSEDHTLEVYKAVTAKNFNGRAAIEYVEQQRLMYLLIFSGMTCVAAVALLVAALGIANTMSMSVLERTREIGIMKAVGAASGQLQIMFLIEGALIGLIGGLLGLLLAWGASFPGDAWVRARVAGKLEVDLDSSIFVFPAWLSIVVLVVVVTVTTLAAFYPARRAARIDPVTALRHE
ncbi:MAG TPA: ABC transporter permease [Pirellulales bacterium]